MVSFNTCKCLLMLVSPNPNSSSFFSYRSSYGVSPISPKTFSTSIEIVNSSSMSWYTLTINNFLTFGLSLAKNRLCLFAFEIMPLTKSLSNLYSTIELSTWVLDKLRPYSFSTHPHHIHHTLGAVEPTKPSNF